MNKKAFRFISLVLCAVMALGTLTGVGFAAQGFPDASRDQWYGEAVYHCVDKGYVGGFEDGTFRPGDPITYAQLTSMLPGGADAVTGGSDVNAPVTRCEMAQIASSVLAAQGLAANVSEAAAVSEYIADWGSIPAGYRDAVSHCYTRDIITGYPDGTFSGGDTLTRAQACVILMRLDKAVADAQPAAAGAKPQPSDDIGADDDALADAPTALLPVGDATQTPDNAVAATTQSGKTKVAYGTAKYPSLSNVDYSTFRRLDYKEKQDKYTYFYDFRDSWYVGNDYETGHRYDSELFTDWQGLWGVYAHTKDDVLTYEVYSYLDNVTPTAVEFRTYDDAETIVLDATPGVEHVRKTKNLANGPYTLCAWFDYTHEDGTVEDIGAWQTLYVSGGHGWFADYKREADDATFKAWLAGKRETLAADDTFQAWVAKQGGNDFTKATDVTAIHYPFKSNTSRYPDNSGKWRQLAHEICPDDDANEYVKARALFAWMQSNIAYDMDVPLSSGYRWAEAAKAGSAKGYTMWDSHLGMCVDFANVYAIMCRELGIPCHTVSNKTHTWNAAYLNGRWELVDVNGGIRSAYVGEDNATYVANAKAYWAEQEAKGEHTPAWADFCTPASSKFKVASYEKDKYTGVEDKIAKSLVKLNNSLQDDAFYREWAGTIYGH